MNVQFNINNNNNNNSTPIISISKVWNNKVEIIKHLLKYKSVATLGFKKSLSQLSTFKDKEYVIKLKLCEDEPRIEGTKDISPNLIPNSIEFLSIWANINIKEDDIKEGVKILDFSYHVKQINFNVIPTTVECLTISSTTKVIIPQVFKNYEKIRSLAVANNSIQLLNYFHNFPNARRLVIDGFKAGSEDSIIIPNNIYHLVFGWYFDAPLPRIPKDIKCLSIGSSLKYQFSTSLLPTSLIWLTIRSCHIFFSLEDFKIFPHLETLQFSTNPDKPTDSIIDVSKIIEIFPNIKKFEINYIIYERDGETLVQRKKKKRETEN